MEKVSSNVISKEENKDKRWDFLTSKATGGKQVSIQVYVSYLGWSMIKSNTMMIINMIMKPQQTTQTLITKLNNTITSMTTITK